MDKKKMDDALEMALKDLQEKLEGKSKEQAEILLNEFKAKNLELIKKESKELFDKEIEAVKNDFEAKLKLVQDHSDKLDVKLQKSKTESKASSPVDVIKSLIGDNGDKIKTVQKGAAIELKVVGDMATTNLTGAAPRSYNYDIVMFPSQKVNVADLAQSVDIDGGTYTYTRELAGEGSIGAQAEGATKNQRDYDFNAIDVTTDFIAGFARYSKKMRNNLSYITSAIPAMLTRDYAKAENAAFNTVLAADATASTEVITGNTKSGMLINEIAKLEDNDYEAPVIVVRPTDYLSILKTAKQDLESAVTYENGVLRVAGAQVVKATWLAANKYFVGDWSRVTKVNTEGLSLEFSEVEGTNFVKNNITARVESQTALAVEQPASLVYGDFTAI